MLQGVKLFPYEINSSWSQNSGTHTKQMPCNKTIKLIWIRDLQRKQTPPPWPNASPYSFTTPFLPILSPPCLWLSPLTLFPQKQEYPYTTCVVSCEYIVFPLHVWYCSKVFVRLVNWSVSQYTLKNKGASKGSSSDAIEEPFLVPQRTIQSKVL